MTSGGPGKPISFAEFNAQRQKPQRVKRDRSMEDTDGLQSEVNALKVHDRKLQKAVRIAVDKTPGALPERRPPLREAQQVEPGGSRPSRAPSYLKATASSRMAVRSRSAPAGHEDLSVMAAAPSLLDAPVSAGMPDPLSPLGPDGVWVQVVKAVDAAKEAVGRPQPLPPPIQAETKAAPSIPPSAVGQLAGGGDRDRAEATQGERCEPAPQPVLKEMPTRTQPPLLSAQRAEPRQPGGREPAASDDPAAQKKSATAPRPPAAENLAPEATAHRPAPAPGWPRAPSAGALGAVPVHDLVSRLGEPDPDKWKQRADALQELRQRLVDGGEASVDAAAVLRVSKALVSQVGDLRSQIVKEACLVIKALCDTMPSALSSASCDALFTALLKNTYVTIKVIASSSRDAALAMAGSVRPAASLATLGKVVAADKHGAARCVAIEVITELVHACDVALLEAYADGVEATVRKALSDADASARANGGRLFWAYVRRFPARQGALECMLDPAQMKVAARNKPK